MRIGLYGGSFDPVHLGHLLVAQAALEEMALDRIVFLPAARSPFKPDTSNAPGGVRMRMLRMALAGGTRFDVDDLELRRGGVSYTVDTVREIAARHPGAELCWLIGADHVPTLPQWREAAALAGLVEFVVIPRPGEPAAEPAPPFRSRQMRGWPLRISSSEIRRRVAAGLPVRHLLPAGVAEVVANERLYLS